MRYPNLRYGNPNELQHYAQGIPLSELAKRLRRSERTVRDWINGKTKVPYWVPELMRLWHWEYTERMRQMNMAPVLKKLRIVSRADAIPIRHTDRNLTSLSSGQPNPALHQEEAEQKHPQQMQLKAVSYKT